MKKISSNVLASVGLLFLLLQPFTALAENWWDAERDSTKTDAVVVENETMGDQIVAKSAARSNWEQGYIEVMAGATADMTETINQGHAYAMAIKTARHLAYEKLAETVSGLNLYSDATYDRELMVDSNLRTVLKAKILNAIVVKEDKKQFSDGSVWAEVTLGLKMFSDEGLIKPTLSWADRNPVKITAAQAPVPVEETAEPRPEPLSTEKTDTQELPSYTGLILDAGGKGGSPAMLPKLLSDTGDILYGTGDIDREYIVRFGLMGYQKTLAAAKKSDRVGSNPLVIPVVKVAGKNSTDFVISSDQADLVRQASAKENFLKECRVIAVLN